MSIFLNFTTLIGIMDKELIVRNIKNNARPHGTSPWRLGGEPCRGALIYILWSVFLSITSMMNMIECKIDIEVEPAEAEL